MTKYAKEPFAYFDPKVGVNVAVRDDEPFNDADPLVKRYPDRFHTPKERSLPGQ